MEIDIAQLAAQIAAFLAPYLPYLIKGGKIAAKKAFEKAGERFVEKGWEQAENLWGKLKPKVEAKPSAQDAIEEFVKDPKEEDALPSMRQQIKKILAEDLKFAEEISIAVGEVNISSTQAGDQSVIVGRDVSNSNILIGKDNKVIQANTYIEGNVYNGPAPRNPQDALKIYRDVMASMTSSISMRGIDLRASDPNAQKAIGLANIYIDLDTTTPIRRKVGKSEAAESENELKFGGFVNDVLSALEAVIQNPTLVIKGDPGSGKSTFVNYITHCLATQSTQRLVGWNKEDSDLLPIIVILRDFVRAFKKLPPQAEPRHIWDFIEKRLKDQNLSASSKPIQNILQDGKAIVFLDGLDEVSTIEQRVFVRDAVNTFTKRYPKNRYIVTCRILSYQPPKSQDKPDLRLMSFPEFELAQFDDEKINSFIDAWYREATSVGITAPELASDLNTGLKTAVQRVELAKLASNPLLLTVMAVVNTNKGRLPDARALLYEETIEILLWQWEQASKGQEARLRQLLLEADCADTDLKQVIWELAYEAHAQTNENDDGETLTGISELKLQKSLAAINKGDLNWAARVIEAMKMRAGLLLERDNNVFTFPHRSFQEFLAGTYLESKDDFVSRAKELANNQLLWRQTILWAVSRRVYIRGPIEGPLALVAELCLSSAPKDESGWSKVWLAGDILLEIGLNRVERSELGKDLLPRVQNRLKELVEGNHLTPRERAEAGDTLAKLGDPRFDEQNWQLPKESLLGFVHIPAGEFLMGTKENDIKGLIEKFGGDEEYYKIETPQHPINLPDYYISRYPVTVAQFKSFVEESGYKLESERSSQGIHNHPIVNVTWYDALEYCKWLTAKLKDKAGNAKAKTSAEETFWQRVANGKLVVILPSEAEWEKAARGADHRVFPWQENEITPNHANYRDANINTTSAVASFPLGKSPYGIQDMSGNVWEWTRSLWGKDWQKPEYIYPYKNDDGRENISAKKDIPRVLRGGAFTASGRGVRCAYRSRGEPFLTYDDVGFRVVVSPFF